MPQLDGLRCFAVIAVMVHHNWRPDEPWLFDRLNWGDLGVRLFFVLSGFLITGILLGGITGRESDRPERMVFLRNFYARRFLRIVPVYYFVLLVLIVNRAQPTEDLPWLATFTTNIYIWLRLDWIDYPHLWTLAVEEQFYLVWPWLVLFLRRSWLLPALVALISLGPLYRLFATFQYPEDTGFGGSSASLIFPLGVVDSLGLGALLALAFAADPDGKRLSGVLTRVVLPMGVALFVLTRTKLVLGDHAVTALGDLSSALIFCWLVGMAARGFPGIAGRLLEWGPIRYVGKISYGAYLFHLLVPYLLLAPLVDRFGGTYENKGLVNFVVTSLLTIGIAALSWHLFEAPINRLRHFFPYRAARAVPGRPS